ncbi:MAG: hypothetical protein JO206_07910 [Solirubrobacterales bacterium]|nr:hypothetical protein [Solirubrobacterales bacterium]
MAERDPSDADGWDEQDDRERDEREAQAEDPTDPQRGFDDIEHHQEDQEES